MKNIVRLFSGVSIFLFVSILYFIGCGGMGMSLNKSKEAQLKRMKRGRIEKGEYVNDFYKFTITFPRGWDVKINDPPIVARFHPTSRDIHNSAMRKHLEIRCHVRKLGSGETPDSILAKFLRLSGYTLVSRKDKTLDNAQQIFCHLAGEWEDQPEKSLAVISVTKNFVIIVECRTLRPYFKNIEAVFLHCLDSLRITSESIALPTPTPTPLPYDWRMDYFEYYIQEGDTGASLAKLFLGDEKRAWFIIKFNDLKEFKPGMTIKIPRYIPYTIQAGDTWDSIAEQILGDTSYARWVKKYNADADWSPGKTIHVPLYEMITPKPREGYVDVAKRTYRKTELADILMIYNDNEIISRLKYVKVPISQLRKYHVYKVQRGDTLAMIAKWFTGDVRNFRILAEENNISKPYTLTLGQLIKIPMALISDPSVLKKPMPRPKPRPRKKAPKKKEEPVNEENMKPEKGKPSPTPTPVEIEGAYEP